MIKKVTKLAITALSTGAFVVLGLGGVASAGTSSIYNTGPGSTNYIGSGWGGSIHTTGPWSHNAVNGHGSGWWHGDYTPRHCGMKWAHGVKKSKPAPMYPMSWNGWHQDYEGGEWHMDDESEDSEDHGWDHGDEGYDHETEHPKSTGHMPHSGGGSTTDVEIDNDVEVDADIEQSANSGNATVKGNTNGGDAETGEAENEANVEVEVEVENNTSAHAPVAPVQHSGSGSIENTGPGSHNYVGGGHHGHGGSSYSVKVSNDVSVGSNVSQHASTGNATVSYNTNGGSAKTGNASNSSSSSFSVKISN